MRVARKPASGAQLLIPRGFLHGLVTLADDTIALYKVDSRFDAGSDGSVRWDSVGIAWGIDAPSTLSDKDRAAPAFGGWTSPFEYGVNA